MAGGRTSSDWKAWALAVAPFLAIKLWIFLVMPPIGDEAYYWAWSQHPALSYFDHPPLHAWLLGLVGQVLGWNLYALRALTWLTLAITAWIFWYWARQLSPDDPKGYFWRSALLYLASPLFLAMSTIAFQDHLLIALCLAACHFMVLFAMRYTAEGRGFRWLYLAALLLGLATLTKYNAVFVGLAFLAFLLSNRDLRHALRTPHPWLAALLSVVMQAPVLWWNLSEGFASYRFHLSERWVDPQQATPAQLPLFLLVSIITLSPLVIWGAIRLFRHRPDTRFASLAQPLALWLLALSSVAMLGLAFFVRVFFYWNIVGLLLIMPLLALVLRRNWPILAHAAYGLVVGIVLLINQTVIPISTLTRGSDWVTETVYGWDEVATRVAALKAEHPRAFVATTAYGTAGQLGFALRDPDVVALSPRHDQYDFWFQPQAHAGDDAIIIADELYGVGGSKGSFAAVELVETLAIQRFGLTVYRPSIYLARGYIPPQLSDESSR